MINTQQSRDYSNVIENVHLINIRLIASEVNGFAMMPTEPDLVIHFKIKTIIEENTLHALVTATLTLQESTENKPSPDEPTQGEDTIFFRASYALIYQLKNGDYDEKSINLFLKTNSKFNMYPYFREFVTSHAGKMMLNLPPLPLLKPSQVGKETIRYQRAKTTNK